MSTSGHAAEPPKARRPPSRAWYALTAIPGVIAAIVIVWTVTNLFAGIDQMQRIVMPGEHDLELAAGEHTVYRETQSLVDGVAYHSTSGSLRCALTDRATGQPVALASSVGSATYSFGDYEGEKIFAIEVARAGTYRLACDGDGQPTVLAIGELGVLAKIIWIVVALFLALPTTGIIGYFVHRARHKRR